MISAIDHVALAVRDLDAAIGAYETLLGVAPSWRGRAGGVEQAWLQTGNIAVDLLCATGTGASGDAVRAHLDAHGEGIMALAFAAPDLSRAQRLLTQRGAPCSRPVDITTVAASGAARTWKTCFIDRAATHAAALLLVAEEAAPAPADGAVVAGLDHVVVRTPDPERAAALYGARLGLDMRMDRSAPEWGARLMFFRCGDAIVEIAHDLNAGVSAGPDTIWGLSWRVAEADAAHARLSAAGVDVSEVRTGRKPGTRVFTARNGTCGVPTLMVEPAA
ncbi:MAG: glyoxalase [Alphaproteobacteria bacterium]|nr:glyoxalase [Alphaproteobacteria bacterium]